MAREEVIVKFNEKYLATLAGIQWDNEEKKWFGNAKTKAKFEEYKEKAKLLSTDDEKEVLKEVKAPEQSPLTKEEWKSILESHTSNLELVEAIRQFGMPNDKHQRTILLTLFTEKEDGNYPIYYNDICKYCTQFKLRYPRDYVSDLIDQYQINGKNLEKELNLITDEEERNLLTFVFS